MLSLKFQLEGIHFVVSFSLSAEEASKKEEGQLAANTSKISSLFSTNFQFDNCNFHGTQKFRWRFISGDSHLCPHNRSSVCNAIGILFIDSESTIYSDRFPLS